MGIYLETTKERSDGDLSRALQAEYQRLSDARALLERRLNEIADSPALPEPKDTGSVIRFKKYNQAYFFAAIKIGEFWYITQDGARTPAQGKGPYDWEDLLEWIGERNYGTVEVLS